MSETLTEREAPEIVVHPGLPVTTLDEALPHLRRPFTPQAIRFKVQNVWSGASGCIVVAYIDARLVIERLNAVVGERWTADYKPAQSANLMLGEMTVCGVRRIDVGGSAKGASKDLLSDALKRSAVMFGIGVSVYSLPEIKLYMDREAGVERPALRKFPKQGKDTLVLTDAGHERLRGGYAKWLEETGARLFGQPLDHGDVATSTSNGELEEQGADEAAEESASVVIPLKGPRMQAMVDQARALKDSIAALPGGRERLPGGQFAAELADAQVSPEALETFVARISEIHEELAAGR